METEALLVHEDDVEGLVRLEFGAMTLELMHVGELTAAYWFFESGDLVEVSVGQA